MDAAERADKAYRDMECRRGSLACDKHIHEVLTAAIRSAAEDARREERESIKPDMDTVDFAKTAVARVRSMSDADAVTYLAEAFSVTELDERFEALEEAAKAVETACADGALLNDNEAIIAPGDLASRIRALASPSDQEGGR